MQGAFDSAKDYIVECDIFGKTKRFFFGSNTYKNIAAFVDFVWNWLVKGIVTTIWSILKAILCGLTFNWAPFCGGDTRISKLMKTVVSKDARVAPLIAQFGAITYLMFDKNAKIRGESLDQLISLMEFAYAMDDLYGRRIESFLRHSGQNAITA